MCGQWTGEIRGHESVGKKGMRTEAALQKGFSYGFLLLRIISFPKQCFGHLLEEAGELHGNQFPKAGC